MGLVILVRHGETDWNKAQRVMGASDIGLNRIGRKQIEVAASMLKGLGIKEIYTSPYARAKESALILKRSLGLHVVVNDLLREVGYGVWEGQLFSELKKDERYFTYLTDPNFDPGDNIEPICEVQKRGVHFIQSIFNVDHAGTLLVISHGDVIRAIISYYMKVPLSVFRRIRVDNGSISGIEIHRQFAEIKGINLTPHIQTLWLKSFIKLNVKGLIKL